MANRVVSDSSGTPLIEVAIHTMSDGNGANTTISFWDKGHRGLHPDEARALADALISAAREVERRQRQASRRK